GQNIDTWIFDRRRNIPDPLRNLSDITHVLLAIPPDATGDIVFDAHGEDLAELKNLEWVGYLSATSVYGNHYGEWVDEHTPVAPTSRRGSLRLQAEEQWKSLYEIYDLPLHIFRLAGIYGPGRSAIDSVLSGAARRIDKPNHVFNRVHIDDIVQTLIASMAAPSPGNIYNIADDMPSPSHEIIQYACNLLGQDSPELLPFTQAEMAPIVRSFYKDNKRIRNDKIKNELGIELIYPDYHEGLKSCFPEEV
ncbi:MAG: SDR family oxidoreductase, partial [Proteobacteria bacterium]|nr:SDR family oxidoreductase [Pseudomonadota bacterium]